MLQISTYFEFDLECGKVVELMHAENVELRCLRGKIWVTEENGGADIVLAAGQRFRLTRPGRAVAQPVGGNEAVRCRIYPRGAEGSVRTLLKNWGRRLRTGLVSASQ